MMVQINQMCKPYTFDLRKIQRFIGDGNIYPMISSLRPKGERANPVILGTDFYNSILKIKGDTGAREIIDNNLTSVHYVEFEKNYFIDIDNIDVHWSIPGLNRWRNKDHSFCNNNPLHSGNVPW